MGLSHSPQISLNGLVLCLDAANSKSYPGSGTTWTDLSGNGNTGTLTNGPTYNSANGGVIVLDGSNDYVSISPSGYDLGVNFTVQLWTKIIRFGGGPFTPPGTATRATLISNSYPYSSNQGFVFIATSQSGPSFNPTPGTERFFISIGQDQFGATSSIGSLSSYVNSWVNLSVVVNGTNPIKLYINGIEPAYASQSSGPSSLSYTGGPFLIGARSITEEFLQGSISQVSIYNRALTAAEIAQNYNALRSRYGL